MIEREKTDPEPRPYPTIRVWGSLVVPAGLGSREIASSNLATPTNLQQRA